MNGPDDLRLILLLDRSTRLDEVGAYGLRIAAAAALADAPPGARIHDPVIVDDEAPDPTVDHVPLAGGGRARLAVGDRAGEDDLENLFVRVPLHEVAMGELSLLATVPGGAPTRPDGSLDGPTAMRMLGRVGRLLADAADAASRDPVALRPREHGHDGRHHAFRFGDVHPDAGHAPRVAAALLAEGMRRAGIGPTLADALNCVTTLSAFGHPLVALRFAIGTHAADVPALTDDARAALETLTRPTAVVRIETSPDGDPTGRRIVIDCLRVPPEPLDRSLDPMASLHAERVLAGLKVPTNILRPEAAAFLKELQDALPRP